MNEKTGFAALKKQFLSNDTGHFIQFVKYGIAGGVATVTVHLFYSQKKLINH